MTGLFVAHCPALIWGLGYVFPKALGRFLGQLAWLGVGFKDWFSGPQGTGLHGNPRNSYGSVGGWCAGVPTPTPPPILVGDLFPTGFHVFWGANPSPGWSPHQAFPTTLPGRGEALLFTKLHRLGFWPPVVTPSYPKVALWLTPR